MERETGDRGPRTRGNSNLSQRTPGAFRRPSCGCPMIHLIHSRHLLCLALLFVSAPVPAQDLESLSSGAKADLRKALDELAVVRQEIEADRLPLARQLTELESQL